MNLYKKCPAKPFLFLVIDAALASDRPLPSWQILVPSTSCKDPI